MAPAYSRQLRRHVPTKPAFLVFELPPAPSPHKQTCRSGRKEGSKRVVAVVDSESEKEVRLEKPGLSQGRREQCPRVYAHIARGRVRPQCGGSPKTASLRSQSATGCQWRPAEVAASAVLRCSSRLSPAVLDNSLQSSSSTLVSLLRTALSKNAPGKHSLHR